MMAVIGRGLVAASQTDEETRRELAAFTPGMIIAMKVIPAGPSFAVVLQADGTLKLLPDFDSRATLTVVFKHLAHAFLVFSFQESTTRAFANDRLYVDGDISQSVRLVRVLNRMEALILPQVIAEKAVKRYPAMAASGKLRAGARIYGRLARNFLKGDRP
ncbi:MAG: SCP2 sterol-binding domain-containing protein [Myxococcales bacterium]|nr:SCP2 sterol-binding domain-containing protein [Myxococcales bacterium]